MTRPSLEDLHRTPMSDLWPLIERRLDEAQVEGRRGRRGSPRPGSLWGRAALIAATICVLVVVAMFLGDAFLTGSPGTSVAPGGSTRVVGSIGEPTVTRSFRVPDYLAYPLAVGAGGVWGGARTHDGVHHGAIRRFDPLTGAITAQIDLASEPRAITVAGSVAWATVDRVATPASPWTWRPSLLRIDASSGRVTGTWRLPERGQRIAVGFGAVWVDGAHYLARLDLVGGSITRITVDVPGDFSLTTLAISDGSVWAGDCIDGAPSTLFRFDPIHMRVTSTRAFSGCIVQLAPGSSGVWLETLEAGDYPPVMRRLDPATLRDATRPITFGRDFGATMLGERAGTSWVFLERGDAYGAYLARVEPTTGRPIGDPVLAHHDRGAWDASWPVYGDGAIWVMVQNSHQLAAIQLCERHWFFWRHCSSMP